MPTAKWFNHLYYFCIRIMQKESFSSILAECLAQVALDNGHPYREGAARAWGSVGAAYLGFALCGLPSTELRALQYGTRSEFGPVILDCRWYDALKKACLKDQKSIQALLPGPDDTLHECTVTQDLLLEMLDFCREG